MLKADLSPWPKLYMGFDLLPIRKQRKLDSDWTLLHTDSVFS